ncbi:hypothetical protein A3L12_02740 [Thermococcus sp. P6]|uniref:hypothetical protein n=1 Tax=Thermococcus sp. P6 TaxID=122420 RepID=UPI000B599CE3|nr:hypothetical protein [Thermococcus sp. P6]ASJ10287.1 hypothetical protein A3L12_02740 [Thermococcus sp. P6]
MTLYYGGQVMDIITAVILAALPILASIYFTRYLGEEYAWINRKIIHFSIVPAAILYYFDQIPREVFSPAAFIFGLVQLIFHIKKNKLGWYQIKSNYGEVFFAFSASLVVFALPKSYATAILLAMAISDGVTGVIRFAYFRRNGHNVKLKKHWSGSLGYFLSTLLISALVLPEFSWPLKVVWGIILTLAEYQAFLDDNLAVPLVGTILKLFI